MGILCLFGGTFNPVHNGHLAAARQAAARLYAEEIVFIPARVPPHKDTGNLASAHHRLAMLHLALAGVAAWSCSDIEIRRPPPSYTIDTVRAFRASHPQAVLNFLTGTDALRHLHLWKEIGALVRECTLVLLARPGFTPAIPPALAAVLTPDDTMRLTAAMLPIATPDISATRVRAMIRAGEDTTGLVPPPVADYIRTHRLYT
ncbi:MAG: nicotinate (nicotinamide) nucleotide adenylyltransferase [Planctomycetota bacterium]